MSWRIELEELIGGGVEPLPAVEGPHRIDISDEHESVSLSQHLVVRHRRYHVVSADQLGEKGAREMAQPRLLDRST